jgi:hypothetical protein
VMAWHFWRWGVLDVRVSFSCIAGNSGFSDMISIVDMYQLLTKHPDTPLILEVLKRLKTQESSSSC